MGPTTSSWGRPRTSGIGQTRTTGRRGRIQSVSTAWEPTSTRSIWATRASRSTSGVKRARPQARLSLRLEAREARRAVHLGVPCEDEFLRRPRVESLLREPSLQASLEDDLQRGHAVHIVLGVRDLVHVDRLETGPLLLRDPDGFREARRGFHRRFPRGETGHVDLLLEVLRLQRAAVVDAERLELLGPDAQSDDVRFRRPDRGGDGRPLRRQAADHGEDGDGREAEADLVHQPFLSEIISSTSSRSFARRSSSRAMTGTPRMLMRTRARSTNMTESFSTTRLRFDTTSALRSRARSASPTPVRNVVSSCLESASNGLRTVRRTR